MLREPSTVMVGVVFLVSAMVSRKFSPELAG